MLQGLQTAKRRREIRPIEMAGSRLNQTPYRKALCDNGTWYSAVIILPHDDISKIELKHVNNTPIIPMKSEKYKQCNSMADVMYRQSDAISGFEEYISIKGWKK